jgi:hypothetical protein
MLLPGCKVDFAQFQFGAPRNRVWVTRIQFFSDRSTSPYGGATALDFSQSGYPTQVLTSLSLAGFIFSMFLFQPLFAVPL